MTAEGTERTMEVTQHVNETTVRCIMLSASEGLGKGMTGGRYRPRPDRPGGRGHPGPHVRPRWAAPLTAKGAWPQTCRYLAHPPQGPRLCRSRKPATEILETGIKVIDLLAPYAKGGKIGLFGGAGVGKDRADPGADPQRGHRARRLLHLYRRGRAQPARAATCGAR